MQLLSEPDHEKLSLS